MGFLDDIFDAVVELPAKVVETPLKIMERLACIGDHQWTGWTKLGNKHFRECVECGKKEVV